LTSILNSVEKRRVKVKEKRVLRQGRHYGVGGIVKLDLTLLPDTE